MFVCRGSRMSLSNRLMNEWPITATFGKYAIVSFRVTTPACKQYRSEKNSTSESYEKATKRNKYLTKLLPYAVHFYPTQKLHKLT